MISLVLIEMNVKEPFTIKELSNGVNKLQDYSTRPVYNGILWMIPYKHHYRKLSRYLN